MTADNYLWIAWWQDADIVVRAVFILLSTLSLTSWSLITYKVRQLRGVLKQEQAITNRLTQKVTMSELQQLIATDQPSHLLFTEAFAAFQKSQLFFLEIKAAQLNQCLREIHLRLEGGLTLLATIGNAAPFIGLFGTVWGIMHALHALGGGDTVIALDTIAGPVSEALVATAAGIFTAIPAVMGYNLLLRRLRYLDSVIEGNSIRFLTHATNTLPLNDPQS